MYTNRLCTSVDMALELMRRSYHLTGTMKYLENVVPTDCQITSAKPTDNCPRGTVHPFVDRDSTGKHNLQCWAMMELGRLVIVDTACGGTEEPTMNSMGRS